MTVDMLWRKTCAAFWNWPALWVPVALASLLGYGIFLGYDWVSSNLFSVWFVQHSVLAPSPAVPSAFRAPVPWQVACFALIRLLSFALYTWVFVVALVWTTGTWQRIAFGQGASLRGGLEAVPARSSAIGGFALRALAMCLLGGGLVFGSMLPVFRNASLTGHSGIIIWVMTGAFSAGIAYVLTPGALNLVAARSFAGERKDLVRACRVIAIAGTCASAGVTWSLAHLRGYRGTVGHVVFGGGVSLASGATYIPVFLAIGIAVFGDAGEPTVSDETFDAPQEFAGTQ